MRDLVREALGWVGYLERSDEFAALSLTSWRARLRPDARRGFFFFGFPEAMKLSLCVCGCCRQNRAL